MMLERLLLAEDELVLRESLEHHLKEHGGFEVVAVNTLAAARAKLALEAFDLVITDVKMPDGLGTGLLAEINQQPVPPLVVVISGFGSPESAVECLSQGAFAYLFKPFTNAQLEVVLRKAESHAQLLKVIRFLSGGAAETNPGLLGTSPAIEQLRQMIPKAAPSDACVLVQGEIGTGKSLVARLLYEQSRRAEAPCLNIDCTRLPEAQVESELFGCDAKAVRGFPARPGRCEFANGRTLLIEEVGALPAGAQARLMRLLQTKTVERIGGGQPIPVDARVIATTSRDLEAMVRRGAFREDLWLALNMVPLRVPPLRQRFEDIPLLAAHFGRYFARKHGLKLKGFSAESLRALQAYAWPGNVRELRTVVEQAVLRKRQGVVEPRDLNLAEASAAMSLRKRPKPPAGDLLREIEKQHICGILTRCDGNRTQAARRLGISIRTLRNKLREYRLEQADRH